MADAAYSMDNRAINNDALNKTENGDVTPFRIKDCALIVQISDILPAINLREFLERVAQCSLDSIYHHFCETVLRPTFDDPEFHNDFARWARRALHDHVLAEKLEILNPYEFSDLEELRKTILDIIDDHLSEIHTIPWAMHDQAFFFHSATTVIFDSDRKIENPSKLGRAVSRMTTGSIYYHFWEARRRTPDQVDDFTMWLHNWNDRGDVLIAKLAGIDFYYISLRELQKELVKIFNVSTMAGSEK